jgi:predicted molibdopterin-dependent oxidoreductase YjgC
MFIKLSTPEVETVSLNFEGEVIQARQHLSVAAALLESGIKHFRDTPVTHSARSPYCMMGVCFDCLLIIDGLPNQQSCMTQVREGMVIQRQSGEADLLNDNAGHNGAHHE